ncbi:MAG: putative thioesterase [Pirellula sp.]|nr:putative thioesterase [Pirellula sp.]
MLSIPRAMLANTLCPLNNDEAELCDRRIVSRTPAIELGASLPANFTETSELWWGKATCADPKARFFLFPYAGGGARVFHGWSEQLPRSIDLRALQLPGRDLRHREPGINSMVAVVEAIVTASQPLLTQVPCVFFGYSLGGLVAFETARRLRTMSLPQPRRLIVAASAAPQRPQARSPLVHKMTNDELVEELRRFKGTPEIVLQTPELLELLLPVIRADFSVLETYQYEKQLPLEIPISALGGLADEDVAPEALADWNEQTSAGFQMRFLPGDHFFLKTAQTQLLELLARELQFVH